MTSGQTRPLGAAREHFAIVAEAYPRSYQALFNLGRTAQLEGRRAEAETAIRKALRLEPQARDVEDALARRSRIRA